MFRTVFALLAAGFLAACQPSLQTTSGTDYLARAPIADPAIRAAAAVEPDLRLPARIGVARLAEGRLSLAPPEEAALWDAFTARHAAMGEWIPISPMVERLVGGSDTQATSLDRIRRAAARQHVDYVLIYDIGTARGPVGLTPLAVVDVTLIGGLALPTRTTEATASAAAAFLDVRSGYPYGTVTASERLNGLGRSWHGHEATERLRVRAGREVAQSLLPKVDEMLVEISARAGR